MEIGYVVFCVVLCLTHLVQGITGFGAIVLALPFLVLFFPLDILIPSLVLVNMTQAAWFAIAYRRDLTRRHALSMVLLSLAGLPVGYMIYKYLPNDQLKIALGFVVIFVAVWNLSGLGSRKAAPRVWYHALNFLGGIAQGSLACGGAFIVIYAARMIENKSEFRANLCLVWTVLNIVLCLTYTASGAWNMKMTPLILMALPCIVFGTILGIVLHERIPEKPFRTLVFIILLASGLFLLKPLVF